MKHLYDKRTIDRKFDMGNMVLLWNAKKEENSKHGNFDPNWLGPYLIHGNKGEDSYYLKELSRYIIELLVWIVL